jgi:hypothetical protein
MKNLEVAPKKSGIWFAEPKYNGWRALIHTPTGAMWNRHGQRLTIKREFDAAPDQLRPLADSEAYKSNKSRIAVLTI